VTEGVWGQSLRSKHVHLFINGKMACHRNGHGLEHMDAQTSFKNWDINHPDTCPKCKAWARLINKGLEIKVHPVSPHFTSSS